MDTGALRAFAREARRRLKEQVGAKLALVLAPEAQARREAAPAVAALEAQIGEQGEAQVIERVAYLWFNRLSALRFMDANALSSPRIVSPAPGDTRPELLAEALAGHLPDNLTDSIAERVRGLIDGRIPSRDPQGETYRLLLAGACNALCASMPFLFEPIGDASELLMPEDLLATDSVLARLLASLPDDAAADVEAIGWLYQFYIAEKKDEVFAALKRNVKITPENIPAATQLFTPHWIVRYLVENSLGRLWLLNRPRSGLAAHMPYFIAPQTPESDFLAIGSPTEIRLCDPACGSGHMLTYAFDLLHLIYEEEGYEPAEIPALILRHNLFGVEIDERAAGLAAFALVMKAAQRRGRRFLRTGVRPNICVLDEVHFRSDELDPYIAAIGGDIFTADLRATLAQFTEAKNFGSLIRPTLTVPADARRLLEGRGVESNLFLRDTHARVLNVLKMAEYLAPRYHVVVANPPYMGGKGMNARLSEWVKAKYPASKADFMACFMERSSELTIKGGSWGMINIPSWMFLSSFERLRAKLILKQTVVSLLHLGRGIFGADFGTVAFVFINRAPIDTSTAVYRRLFTEHVQVRSIEEIRDLFIQADYGRFQTRQTDLLAIPGYPIAYWLSPTVRNLFKSEPPLQEVVDARQGLATADNGQFLRLWWEVGSVKSVYDATSADNFADRKGKWAAYNKGGQFRRWYGNSEYVVNWEGRGRDVYAFQPRSVVRNPDTYFLPSVSWSDVTTSRNSFRAYDQGSIYDSTGHSAFPSERMDQEALLCLTNTRIFESLVSVVNPTIHFHVGYFKILPALRVSESHSATVAPRLISLARTDWDSYETSWNFAGTPLLAPEHRRETLAETYDALRAHRQGMTDEMHALEEANNRIFINAYGLTEELAPEVPLHEITLTCNPAYRYGAERGGGGADGEALMLADTMRELLSYAIGCMMGRYSLDVTGLVLADAGGTADDYLARLASAGVHTPRFKPDADNVLPITEGDWFPDDVASRFRRFLRTAFGAERVEENMAFVEAALGKDVRRWLLKDFWADHLKRYRKRPIYWLFSSPKGTFNALVYLHRYRPETAGLVLNDYLRPLREKLDAARAGAEAMSRAEAASPRERTAALKQADSLTKQVAELDGYERETLYPLAQRRIALDLDDGVSANYPKLGRALRPIPGLADAED